MNFARTLCLRVCLVLAVGFLPAAASAGQPDLLHYEHENLRTGQVEALNELRGEATLLMFFEPDCKWCLRQTRTLDAMLKTCPLKLNAAALGVHANRHELKAELRRLRPDFPAYMTGRPMLREMQGVPATPVMLLADREGRFVQHFTGYIPEDQLTKILSSDHDVRCTETDDFAFQQ